MPNFLTPLHEFNSCHTPAGPGGGQFCAGASGPPSGGGPTAKSYGKFADALLARIDDRGHHIIMFGTTGKRSRNRSKNHFGMRDRAAAEKLRKAGVIKIESGGVSSYKPRTGSWRTAWATEWVLSRA
jgi:hypothetical protein